MPPSPEERPRRRIREASSHPVVVWGAFLVGALGLVVAILSYRLSRDVQEEQKAVEVSAYPTLNIRDFTTEGYGVRVAIINAGLRPVVVRGASLWMDGKRVARAVGFLPDTRILDRYTIAPGRVTEELRQLPTTVSDRGARTIALLFDYTSEVLDRTLAEQIRKDEIVDPRPALRLHEQRLQEGIDSLSTLDERDDVPFMVQLDLVPGGPKRFPAVGVPGMTPRFDWQVFPVVAGRDVLGMDFRRKNGAPGESDVVRLDVWSREDDHRTVERPVIGTARTFFPLRSLPPGLYTYAFRLGGQTLIAGRFDHPVVCRRRWGWGAPGCPTPWNLSSLPAPG